MYSLSFPDIFKAAGTNLLEDKQAAISNLKLVIASEKRGLFGDPDFGTNLKMYLYNQNNVLLREIIIDELYNIIRRYTPQLQLTRKNIKIISYNENLFAEITCTYIHDTTTDMYSINLTEE